MLVTECWDYRNKAYKYHYVGIKNLSGRIMFIFDGGTGYFKGSKWLLPKNDELKPLSYCMNCKWALRQVLGKCKRTSLFESFTK